MKTIILEKPGELRRTETESPADVPVGSALVRVNRVGVCGTDWHAYRGKQPFFSYPRVLGHELGVVVERVVDVCAGARVAADGTVGDAPLAIVNGHVAALHREFSSLDAETTEPVLLGAA